MAKAVKKPTQKTVKPGKDFVAATAKDIRAKLLKSIEQGVKDLTINMAGVKALDPVGLGVLIATHNSLNKAGGKLKVTNVSRDIFNFIKAIRLEKKFEIQAVK